MPEFRLPEVFPLLPLDLFPAGGGEEPLVARSVRASSILSLRFIRELGILELLSFSELQLFYVRLALSPHLCAFDEVMGGRVIRSVGSAISPVSSLHARRGGETGEIFECRSC